ncbi:MAG: DNRLRE domain-containing protein [Limisphaerales bacterium]
MPRGLVPALLATLAASAESLVLRPVADTSLFAVNRGTNNLGASSTLVAGANFKGEPGRALLRFDVAGAIPADAVVTRAVLSVAVTQEPQTGGVASDFTLHRMLASWSEGRGTGNLGLGALPGEPTWTHRAFPGAAWAAPGSAPGAEHFAAPSATIRLAFPEKYTFPDSAELRADIQHWLAAPDRNFGWLLRSTAEGTPGTARRIAARETPADAPELEVEFIRVTRPAFGPVGRDGDALAIEFTVPAGNIYALEALAGLGGTNWITVTNVAAKLADVPARVLEPLDQPQHFYRLADVADID